MKFQVENINSILKEVGKLYLQFLKLLSKLIQNRILSSPKFDPHFIKPGDIFHNFNLNQYEICVFKSCLRLDHYEEYIIHQDLHGRNVIDLDPHCYIFKK